VPHGRFSPTAIAGAIPSSFLTCRRGFALFRSTTFSQKQPSEEQVNKKLNQVQREREIRQQALEIDFLQGCFEPIDELRKLQALEGKPLSTSRYKTKGRDARA